MVGRVLNPVEFGTFNSINSLGVILSAPVAVLPLVFSRYTVQLEQENPQAVVSLLAKGFKVMLGVALVFLVAGVSSVSWLKNYLHIEQDLSILLMLFQLAISLVVPVFLGVLQGLHRFGYFGMGTGSSAMTRFLSGLLLVAWLGWGVNGALLAGVLGAAFSITVCAIGLKDYLKAPSVPLKTGTLTSIARYSFPVFLATSLVIVLGNIDIVLVRHFCKPEEAGLYATAAVLGRIAFFLPNALIHVLFPEVAKAHESGANDHRPFILSLILTTLLGGGFAFICMLWPGQLIRLLFGGNYSEAAPLLTIITEAMALLAIANVVFTYSLAKNEFQFIYILGAGVFFMLTRIYWVHHSAESVAQTVLISTLGILLVSLAWRIWKFRSSDSSG